MIPYLIGFLFIFLLLLYSSPEKQKEHRKLLYVWWIYVMLLCALRDMLGGFDGYIYGEIFDLTAEDLRKGIPFNHTYTFTYNPTELGYALYNVLIGIVVENRYIFLFVTSIIIYAILGRHIIKYSNYPTYASFIIFCLFYFFTFTYLRQVMAALIAWYAIPFAIKRKPVQFFAIVALATSFHNSALFFSVTYFVVNRQFTRRQVVIYFVIGLLLGLTPLGSFLMQFVGENINSQKTEQSLSGIGSARIEYIIEAVFFLWILLSQYRKLQENKQTIAFLNIALLFVFTLLFLVRFSDGGRFSWSFLIGIAFSVANIYAKSPKRGLVRILTFCVMGLLYFRILLSWGLLLSPYKTFLTNGVREDDFIWEENEYDHRYDEDKLYKIW